MDVMLLRALVGLSLLCSMASASPLDDLKAVKRWKGTIEFHDDDPLKVDGPKHQTCTIGKNCVEVYTAKSENLLGATIVADGKTATASAQVGFRTHISTEAIRTFSEQCGSTGSMLNPKPGPTKGGRIEERSSLDGEGKASVESYASVEILSATEYKVSFRVPPIEGTQKVVETFVSSGGCYQRKKDLAPPTTMKAFSMNYSIDHRSPLPALPANLSTLELAGTGARGNQKFTWSLRPVIESTLVADAGRAQTVAWGKSVKLDGSRSKGKISRWEWRVTNAECATESELKTLKVVNGKTVTFQPLCSLDMELTVSDGKEAATASVHVDVTRRAWKTPAIPKTTLDWKTKPNAVTDAKWGKPSMTYEGANKEKIWPSKLKWGENVCLHDDKTTVYGITHPHPAGGLVKGAEWRGGGLEIETMKGGPFDGWHYVKSSSIVIERKAIFNEWVHPDAKPPFPEAGQNIATANAKVFKDWRLALEQHEGDGNDKRPKVGHTKLIREGLKQHPDLDPRHVVEPLAAPDRMRLWGKADGALLDVNRRLLDISAESDIDITPDKLLWQGNFLYWNTTIDDWVPAKDSL